MRKDPSPEPVFLLVFLDELAALDDYQKKKSDFFPLIVLRSEEEYQIFCLLC